MYGPRFTTAERRLAQTILEQFVKRLNENKSDTPYATTILRPTLDSLKLKYKLASGSFRVAVITKTIVIKLPDVCTDSGFNRLKLETAYIRRMNKTQYKKHFPLTELFTRRGVALQLQRVVPRIDHRLSDRFDGDVCRLGELLGVDDVKPNNYGWAGPAGREWPVFIDMDIRSGRRRRSRKSVVTRTWMVR